MIYINNQYRSHDINAYWLLMYIIHWFETIGLTLDLSFVKTDGVLINSRHCPPMVGSVLRTPISAKYCWFGWWLGAWSTPCHHPTQLCDIYISGYKYTLISEWTRLFGLLRILDNLISGAVCYFLYDYFCILWNIHLTHARSCSCRHSLSWVVFYAVVRSWACVSVPISDKCKEENVLLDHHLVSKTKYENLISSATSKIQWGAATMQSRFYPTSLQQTPHSHLLM